MKSSLQVMQVQLPGGGSDRALHPSSRFLRRDTSLLSDTLCQQVVRDPDDDPCSALQPLEKWSATTANDSFGSQLMSG